MTRVEALVAAAVAFLMLAGGAVWEFGAYGLLAAGVVALVAVSFVNPMDLPPKKVPKKPKG